MKKLLVIPAIIGLLVTGAFAADKKVKEDDDKNANVSYAVVNQFKSDFRDAENVTWTVTETTQKAEFTLDGVKMTAFYNLNGDYMGTTKQVAYKAISARAQKEIASRYKDYTVGQVIELNSGDGIQHFVDLKSSKDEILVRVAPTSAVYYFQQVK
ncbi:hypothetical protein LT679_03530 [Mucilaginibacter roseus]|uniref:Beta-lactamase-inhibitor-like PepSY-like domain-containing protein n=1 Tax=Mucilaginibacter roseus TaxID=1528868 RepID=A0ABS8U176_9SPHI|nr:hypothetical protein [Mucilaginibacter roseus]MCD8739664.1 hypothetical protein [Mucilaginibacter roseus]